MRWTRLGLGMLGALASVGSLGEAQGSPVTWEFAGEVRWVVDRDRILPESVTAGAPFSGSFTFESTTPDSIPDDRTNGFYEGALIALSGMIGGVPFAFDSLIDIRVLNDNGPTVPHDDFVLEGDARLSTGLWGRRSGLEITVRLFSLATPFRSILPH